MNGNIILMWVPIYELLKIESVP